MHVSIVSVPKPTGTSPSTRTLHGQDLRVLVDGKVLDRVVAVELACDGRHCPVKAVIEVLPDEVHIDDVDAEIYQ